MTTWGCLTAVLVAFSALALATSSLSRLFVWRWVKHRSVRQRGSVEVEILKPLCGADATLAENLSCFARQTHEELGVVFGAADTGDEALPVALNFCRERQGFATRISVGEEHGLYNPKLALLARMSRSSRAQWLVVSDSNVRVHEEYVEDALARAAPDVGLVTHWVAGRGGSSIAAHLENLQLNCFVAPGVSGARLLAGRTCVIGKSMFLRREALERIGGFAAAGTFLAEDYVMGQALEKQGYRVVTAETPVAAWSEGWTLRRFFNRHLRWAVMRRRISLPAYAAEVLLTPAPALLGLLAIALAVPETGLDASWVAAALLYEQALDAATYTRMTGRCVPWQAVALNPLRQCLTLILWTLGWSVRTVAWRGKVYRVGSGSRLEPVAASPSFEVG